MKKNKVIAIIVVALLIFSIMNFWNPTVTASTQTYNLDDISYTIKGLLGETIYTVSVIDLQATFENSDPYKIRITGTIEFEASKWGPEVQLVFVDVALLTSTSCQETNPPYGYYRSGGDAPYSAYLTNNEATNFAPLWGFYTGWNTEYGILYTDIHPQARGCILSTLWDFPMSEGDTQYRSFDYTVTFSEVAMTTMFWVVEVVDYYDVQGEILWELSPLVYSMVMNPIPKPEWVTVINYFCKLIRGTAEFYESGQKKGNIDIFWILPIGSAVDNEELDWSAGGHQLPQRSFEYYYDSDAMRLGDNPGLGLIHNQNSYIQTTVTGPGTLKFYWKVSSQAGCDVLRFRIDGNQQDEISGSVDWQQKSYTISSGSHTLKWIYTKDGSGSSGSDCGWVDYVQVYPTSPPNVPELYGPYLYIEGDYVLQSVTRTNTEYIFGAYASDPDSDLVRYVFDWGDGTTDPTGWFFEENHPMVSHSWSSVGTYTVKVRAYDPGGLWSESQLTVNIEYSTWTCNHCGATFTYEPDYCPYCCLSYTIYYALVCQYGHQWISPEITPCPYCGTNWVMPIGGYHECNYCGKRYWQWLGCYHSSFTPS